MPRPFFFVTLCAVVLALASVEAFGQTAPLTQFPVPEAVPIKARVSAAVPAPPPAATVDSKGAVVGSPAAATRAPGAAPSVVPGIAPATPPVLTPLPPAQANPDNVGFPVLPLQTARPILPNVKVPPRSAPLRADARPPVPNAQAKAGGGAAGVGPFEDNTAPDQFQVQSQRSSATARASVPQPLAPQQDELQSLMAPPESPQTRGLPGLGAAPGAINSANPMIVRSRNGVNTLIPLALKYPNRIVTPFKRPEVIDDGIETLIKGNSIYVKLDESSPRGVIFINDADAPGGAVIQLTLIGRVIPPQTVIVQLDAVAGVVENNDDSDYVSSIKSLVRVVLRGGTPQGYTDEQFNLPMVSASQQLLINAEKRYSGSTFEILRYSIRNVGTTPITLTEEMFGGEQVRAVSFYPSLNLQPNESTSVFIVAKLAVDQ